MASERDNFDLSGPRNLHNLDWNDPSHRRIVAGALVQAVYVLERDRQEKRQSPQDALAPAWWTFFHYNPVQIMVDKVEGSIFGAVFERAENEKHQTNIPRSVVAFRGSILKPETLRTDLKLDLVLITNGLHKTPRFDFALGAVRSAIAKHGHCKVWVAGHSLGAAFAMLAARKLCEDEGLVLESYLFNPPFASAPLERIKNEKVKLGFHVAHSFVTAGLAMAVIGKTQDGSDRDAFAALSSWTPNLYVNPADDICSGYVGYFGNRERIHGMGFGVGRIDDFAARHSINESIMAAFGKESKASYLIPSAKLTLNLGPSPDFKRAHGIHQWWSPDLQFRCTLFRLPASKT
ncbi:hypothetical protein SUGI_0588410 [Cryptomeria japonica]|uniref:GDSL esterase/lipase At4g10955 n=1 Tax=Cryptomeria japonica TaxID=3369 RepID=UPI002414867C|nr:GDSL esterase/lipase At4g10955 [Cryptomeria japonica]GLJ29790.1 hypothetical protein SUGI_0588410 [Cryptomeria japonica]